jgi:hypothetical protein
VISDIYNIYTKALAHGDSMSSDLAHGAEGSSLGSPPRANRIETFLFVVFVLKKKLKKMENFTETRCIVANYSEHARTVGVSRKYFKPSHCGGEKLALPVIIAPTSMG